MTDTAELALPAAPVAIAADAPVLELDGASVRHGECLEAPEHSVNAYSARIGDGQVWIAA